MPEAVHAAYNFPASQLNGNTPALPKTSSSVSPPPVADSSGYTQPGTSPGVGYSIVGQTSIDRYAQQENRTDGYNLPAPQQETKGDGYNLPAAQSAIASYASPPNVSPVKTVGVNATVETKIGASTATPMEAGAYNLPPTQATAQPGAASPYTDYQLPPVSTPPLSDAPGYNLPTALRPQAFTKQPSFE